MSEVKRDPGKDAAGVQYDKQTQQPLRNGKGFGRGIDTKKDVEKENQEEKRE